MTKQKKVKIQLIIDTEEEVPEDWDEESIQFHLEENYCVANIIHRLHGEVEEAEKEGKCSICSFAEIKVKALSND